MTMFKKAAVAIVLSASALGFGSTAFAGQDIGLRYLNNLSSSEKAVYEQKAASNPEGVASLQADIRSNPAVLHSLESRGVQIENVVDVVKPLDGSTIYVIR